MDICISYKLLRNWYKPEIIKWMNNLIASRLPIVHDKENHRFTLDINGEMAKVDYRIKDGKMYLVHSEVPHHLRGQGIGKVLVEKAFEKLTEENYTAVAVCSYIKAVKNRSESWKGIIN